MIANVEGNYPSKTKNKGYKQVIFEISENFSLFMMLFNSFSLPLPSKKLVQWLEYVR